TSIAGENGILVKCALLKRKKSYVKDSVSCDCHWLFSVWTDVYGIDFGSRYRSEWRCRGRCGHHRNRYREEHELADHNERHGLFRGAATGAGHLPHHGRIDRIPALRAGRAAAFHATG